MVLTNVAGFSLDQDLSTTGGASLGPVPPSRQGQSVSNNHMLKIFFFYFNIFFFSRFPPSPSPSSSPPRRHLLSGPQGSQALVEDLSFEEVQRRLELHGHF